MLQLGVEPTLSLVSGDGVREWARGLTPTQDAPHMFHTSL